MASSDADENTQTMRLLAVSDVVEPQLYNESIKEWLSGVDLLVSCGDLPPEYLDFLQTMLNVPLVHVLGNHCFEPHEPGEPCPHEHFLGAYDLNGHVAEYNGLILAGVE